jgi:hypothetical protein
MASYRAPSEYEMAADGVRVDLAVWYGGYDLPPFLRDVLPLPALETCGSNRVSGLFANLRENCAFHLVGR